MREDEYFDFAQQVASGMGLTDVEMELLPYAILSKAGVIPEVTWGLAERNADGSSLITICAPPGRSPRAVKKTIVHEEAHLLTDMAHTERWREAYDYYAFKYGLVAGAREVLMAGVGAVVALGVAVWLSRRHPSQLTIELYDPKSGVVVLRRFLSPREFDKFKEEYRAGKWPDLDWRLAGRGKA